MQAIRLGGLYRSRVLRIPNRLCRFLSAQPNPTSDASVRDPSTIRNAAIIAHVDVSLIHHIVFTCLLRQNISILFVS